MGSGPNLKQIKENSTQWKSVMYWLADIVLVPIPGSAGRWQHIENNRRQARFVSKD